MGLRETMRKAAGLLVEIPPEEPKPQSNSGEPSLDDLLSVLDKPGSGHGSGHPAGPPASTGPGPLASEDQPPAPRMRTVEQVARAVAGPDLDQVKVPGPGEPLPTGPDGKPDLKAIYEHAGLTASTFGAEQMLDMLGSLPAELPLEVRRQTVRVTLSSLGKTVGATPDTIVADASRKLAALAAYEQEMQRHTEEFGKAAETEITALQAQIEAKRQAMQDSSDRLVALTRACEAESHHLDDVLEFFSLDLPPSKYAPGPSEGRPSPGGN